MNVFAKADDPEAVIVQAARRLDKNNIPISQVRFCSSRVY